MSFSASTAIVHHLALLVHNPEAKKYCLREPPEKIQIDYITVWKWAKEANIFRVMESNSKSKI